MKRQEKILTRSDVETLLSGSEFANAMLYRSGTNCWDVWTGDSYCGALTTDGDKWGISDSSRIGNLTFDSPIDALRS